MFFLKIFLSFLSKNKNTISESKKYTAAYFAKKLSPKKIPKSKKLIKFALALILKSINKDSDQKKIKITSVDSIKDEIVTEGSK